MSQPTSSSVHVNGLLTEIQINWFTEHPSIAMLLSPLVDVGKQSDLFNVWDRADLNRIVAERRAPGTRAALGGFTQSTVPYFAHRYAVGKAVADPERENEDDPIRLNSQSVMWCTRQIQMLLERTFGDNAFAAGIWSTNRTGVSGAPAANQFQQWNESGSTPVDDVLEYLDTVEELTGYRPNKLAFGADAWRIFTRHADVIELINGGQTPNGPAVAKSEDIARILEVEEVHKATMIETTSAEGATDVTARILDTKGVLAVFVTDSPSLVMPSALYTFAWDRGGRAPGGMLTKEYRDEPIESDVFECEGSWDPKVTAADLGVFLASAVA